MPKDNAKKKQKKTGKGSLQKKQQRPGSAKKKAMKQTGGPRLPDVEKFLEKEKQIQEEKKQGKEQEPDAEEQQPKGQGASVAPSTDKKKQGKKKQGKAAKRQAEAKEPVASDDAADADSDGSDGSGEPSTKKAKGTKKEKGGEDVKKVEKAIEDAVKSARQLQPYTGGDEALFSNLKDKVSEQTMKAIEVGCKCFVSEVFLCECMYVHVSLCVCV